MLFIGFMKNLYFVFKEPGGATNLWNLVDVICDNTTECLDSYKQGIKHIKHLASFKAVSTKQYYFTFFSSFHYDFLPVLSV